MRIPSLGITVAAPVLATTLLACQPNAVTPVFIADIDIVNYWAKAQVSPEGDIQLYFDDEKRPSWRLEGVEPTHVEPQLHVVFEMGVERKILDLKITQRGESLLQVQLPSGPLAIQPGLGQIMLVEGDLSSFRTLWSSPMRWLPTLSEVPEAQKLATLRGKGACSEALELSVEAIEAVGEDAWKQVLIYRERALCHRRQGRSEDAQREFHQAAHVARQGGLGSLEAVYLRPCCINRPGHELRPDPAHVTRRQGGMPAYQAWPSG